jgi:hypothetical protein
MTDPGPDDARGRDEAAPPRKYKWRYGPVRLVSPWIAVIVGILFVIEGRGAASGSTNRGVEVLFFVGLILIVVGVVSFFLARWMAKKGI